MQCSYWVGLHVCFYTVIIFLKRPAITSGGEILSGHMIAQMNLSVSQQLNCARSACSLVAPWRTHFGCTTVCAIRLHHGGTNKIRLYHSAHYSVAPQYAFFGCTTAYTLQLHHGAFFIYYIFLNTCNYICN